jgi:hypothetical protein
MKIKKLQDLLDSGSFHSDISPEVELALKTKLQNSSKKDKKVYRSMRPMLDFSVINQEAIKLAGTEVKYPQELPKGVIISVKKSQASAL